jgi:hypothetical protein
MANELHERVADALLDRIRNEPYPSVTYMDMFETAASPRQLVEYTLHLMERIESDSHPSIPMMRRVQRLAAAWGPSDERA